MSRFTVTYHAPGRCRITHAVNSSTVVTDLPPEYGGEGRSFSSTDLVCGAVGSCYMTTIEPILERSFIAMTNVRLDVAKKLHQQPKMIEAITLDLTIDGDIDEPLFTKLHRAVALCPVKRSLHPDVAVTLKIHTSRRELP